MQKAQDFLPVLSFDRQKAKSGGAIKTQ